MVRYSLGVCLALAACMADEHVPVVGEAQDSALLDAEPTQPGVQVSRPSPFSPANLCGSSTFCDQAEALGLHEGPEYYGRGAAWVDVDEDGWEDLWLSHDRYTGHGEARSSSLYRNQGDGTFALWDIGIDPDHTWSNWGGIWGDIDNDGDADLYLTNGGYSTERQDYLYRNDVNETGRFTNITLDAGILSESWMSWGGSFADVNNDGFLDLVVTTRARRWASPCCKEDGDALDASTQAVVRLYINDGDGTFTESSAAWGLPPGRYDGKNPTFFDYDKDGYIDLFLANAGTGAEVPYDLYEYGGGGVARLFRNIDGARYADVSEAVFPDHRVREPVFASAAIDHNQDGWDDLYLGRTFEQDLILINKRDGTFDVLEAEHGLDMRWGHAARENTMGLCAGDLTLDGWPDVWVGTGWPDFDAVALPYLHQGQSLDLVRTSGAFTGMAENFNHGCAMTDFDHDGDVDLVSNVGGFPLWDVRERERNVERPVLYVNHRGDAGKSVVVRLVGTTSNRDAIGARIRIEGSETRHTVVRGVDGFQSWNGPWQTIPLGDSDTGTLTITWPSGTTQEVQVEAGTRVRIEEL